MSDTGSNIMGFIPKSKYVQITYWLMLASSGGGLVLSLLLLMGVLIPLGLLFTLCGVAALVLALLGFFIFKPEFSSLDQSHLMYIAILFAAFFVIGLILGSSLFLMPYMLNTIMLVIGAAQLLFIFTGYNSWKHGRTITKDNIKSEIQLATKRS